MAEMVGRTLGAYKITGRIGQGGMANVYRATQPSIGREVAIKVLPPHFLQDPSFVKRFEREVQVIAKLQHPHILPVYDFGQDDNIPYIVMAYMPGGTLADLIRKSAPLPLDEVLRLVEEIASGLDHAHKKGIVHRDFKPSNVLLDDHNNVYLADFGIAKVSESASQITGSGILGTPAYMAPEATQTGKVTPLLDIYALGVTLFEMLAGQHPFPSETPVGVLMAHAASPVPDVLAQRPDLPPGVQAVIDRAMAKDPEARYQTAGALAADLRAALRDDSPLTEALSGPAARRAGGEPAGTVKLPMERPAPTRRAAGGLTGRTLAIIGGAAVIVLIGGAVLLSGGLPGQSPAVTPTAAITGVAPTQAATPDGLLKRLEGHKDAVGSVAFSPDGTLLASGSRDRKIIVWDASIGDRKVTIDSPDEVYSLAFYPDGKTLAAGGQGGALSFWDTAAGSQLFKMDFLPAGQVDTAVSPDGANYAVASRDTSTAVFDAKTFGWLRAVTYPTSVWSVAWSPDGKTLAAGMGDGPIVLKDAKTDADIRTFGEKKGGGVKILAYSPAGKWLAASAANSTEVIVWDTDTDRDHLTLSAHTAPVSALAWSPDGKSLFTASEDGTILQWDLSTGQISRTIHSSGVISLAISPDGKLIASGMEDGSVGLWDGVK